MLFDGAYHAATFHAYYRFGACRRLDIGIDRSWRQTQRAREELHASAHAGEIHRSAHRVRCGGSEKRQTLHDGGAALVQAGQWVSVVTAGINPKTAETGRSNKPPACRNTRRFR
jgi:hypothetical protein